MGRRSVEELLLEAILDGGYESVTFVASNERPWLARRVKGLGIELDVLDYDPKFNNPRDAIFDKVTFNELVIDFNAEKHYPIGKIFKGDMIIIGDNDQHNGDCNPITSTNQIIEQNEINKVDFSYNIDKWYVVKGSNRVLLTR
jgi:hypothetical protein